MLQAPVLPSQSDEPVTSDPPKVIFQEAVLVECAGHGLCTRCLNRKYLNLSFKSLVLLL